MFVVEREHEIPYFTVGQVFDVATDATLWQHQQESGSFALKIECTPGKLAVGSCFNFDIAIPMLSSNLPGTVEEFEENDHILVDALGSDAHLHMRFGFHPMEKLLGTIIDYRAEVELRGLRARPVERIVKRFVHDKVDKSLASGLVEKIGDKCAERYPLQRSA